MWRLAILVACVVAVVSEDGLQLKVKPCSPAAINSGSKNEITITWDEAAGECDYTVTDASKKEVESGKAVGKVNISPMDIGRYLVTLTCAKGSEAMYFDAIFIQSPAEGKLISATALPSTTSAYVSFSSSVSSVSFTCQLDQGQEEECTSPWHSAQHLGSGMHSLIINLSTEQGGALQPAESVTIPFLL